MSANETAITKDDLYLLAKGDWNRSWEKMGAHKATVDGQDGYTFAVWAPNVKKVTVIGEFNDWNIDASPLAETENGGVWQGFVPGASEGQLYKFYILCDDGSEQYKADPYAFWSECPPGTASRLTDLSGHVWKDGLWMGRRARTDHFKRPLNIYEVHLGSWKRHDDGLDGLGTGEGGGSYLTYDELSDELVSYVADMGYTHIELMPVMEHPFDGSWGYQTTGYFAPTARYGDPAAFMNFVDKCHQANIGVILDWVPGGFCRDIQGLVHFNGHKLYEKEEHPNWGTYKFDYSRGEVRTFLTSNALFWLEAYHADGIRMDGVTSMLYLNFGVDDPSQKKFNEKGTEEDLVAIDFVRHVNETVAEYHPDAMMMAEESTAWPLVTRPPEVGGLGFHYKWDMGWMNDTLNYCKTDFPYRPGNHNLLTFSMMYAYSENYILPLSHDEVVHGKASLIVRQPGDWWRQFAGLRNLAFYQMTHPGAKLNFMGNEIAQFIEWRYYEGIQWFLTKDYDTHRKHQHFVRELNHFFRDNKGLWQHNYDESGFEWIDADNNEQSVVSYVRHGDRPVDDRVVIINFDPATHEEFRVGVPREGNYVEVFNTDAEEFGGSGVINEGTLVSTPEPFDRCDDSIVLRLPPLAGVVLKRTGKSSYVAPKKAASKTAPAAKPAAKKATPAAKPAASKKAAAPKAAAPAKADAVKAAASAKAAAPKKAAPAKKAPAKKAAPAKAAAPKAAAPAPKPVKAAETKAAAPAAEPKASVAEARVKKAAAAAAKAAPAPKKAAPAKKASAKKPSKRTNKR